MKVYVSADIEGITGVTHWDEATIDRPGYDEARGQMTREVVAACEGARAAGAKEVWIKDAHDSGRNISLGELPSYVKVIRGWSGNPALMLQELDEAFDAVLMVGYHAGAGAAGNPLAHSVSLNVAEMILNGETASEFLLHAYEASRWKVPTVFVSGDLEVCTQASRLLPGISTVAVLEGKGRSTLNIHPEQAVRLIRSGAERAVKNAHRTARLALPKNYRLNIRYKDAAIAYRASFYPGTELVSATAVEFKTRDFFDVMRMLLFTTAELPSSD